MGVNITRQGSLDKALGQGLYNRGESRETDDKLPNSEFNTLGLCVGGDMQPTGLIHP
jgi:hypothetical protein